MNPETQTPDSSAAPTGSASETPLTDIVVREIPSPPWTMHVEGLAKVCRAFEQKCTNYAAALERIAVYDTGFIQDIDAIQEIAKKALGYEAPAQIGFCDDCGTMIREGEKFGVEEDGGAYWCAECSGQNAAADRAAVGG